MDIEIGSGSSSEWLSFMASFFSMLIALAAMVISKSSLQDSRKLAKQAAEVSFLHEHEGLIRVIAGFLTLLNMTREKLEKAHEQYSAFDDCQKKEIMGYEGLFTKRLPELVRYIDVIKETNGAIARLVDNGVADVIDATTELIKVRSKFYLIQTECMSELTVIESSLDQFVLDCRDVPNKRVLLKDRFNKE